MPTPAHATSPIATTRLGILTPSSNTVLEPLTVAMLDGLPDVTAHFARFRVRRIALTADALAQFDPEPILDAAERLADAKVHAIVWSGTSASWLGFQQDQDLVAAIQERCDVPAGTSVLALNHLLANTESKTLGLVTPYTDDVQAAIVAQYADHGVPVIAEHHLGDEGNYSFATYSERVIEGMVREVAKAGPDAITILCTNLRGAAVAARLEQELGIPIFDSVSTAVWSGLQISGTDPSRVQKWGSLFQHE